MKINAILLGKLIKDARTAENMSSADFAKAANISPSALTRLENPPKIDFRVSYDTLVNALELVGTFGCVKNRTLAFDQHLNEAFARETINLFLIFSDQQDHLDTYIYQKTAPTSEFVCRHMTDMQDDLLDVLNHHFQAKEFQALLVNARERFMEAKLSTYRDNPESYEDNKADFPNRFIVTEEITERTDMGAGMGMKNDIDEAFRELLYSPTMDRAVMLAIAMMKNLAV